MKKLLFITGFVCSLSMANAQESQDLGHSFQDKQHNVIGYIRAGAIIDKNNAYLGEFKHENGQYTVINGQHAVVGHIVTGKEFKDANNKTVGYIQTDRSTYVTTVEDAQHKAIGYIYPDGKIEDGNHTVIAYQQRTEPMWAAAYYFIFKF